MCTGVVQTANRGTRREIKLAINLLMNANDLNGRYFEKSYGSKISRYRDYKLYSKQGEIEGKKSVY